MLVRIDGLDHNGKGIVRVGNKVTFVDGALPGELVDIIIDKEYKKFNVGKVVKIIEKSDKRVSAKCPYYGVCGGCEIMHMSYDFQVDFKRDKVVNILKKYAKIEVNPLVFKSINCFNYRNKITLHNRNNNLGYMKRNSNDIVSIKECYLALPSINSYLKKIKDYESKELVLRANEKGDVISNIDDNFLLININDFIFQIDINSFFQVNNYICSSIFDFISENLSTCENCLDLYSGVGTLSILASKKVNKVYAIEINENSYKNALKNLELNNINNVEFILGDVSEKISLIDCSVDVIITDPPRSGMDEVTIKAIQSFKPGKVIYVSCNPMTLARDLNVLLSDYVVDKVAVFDMFPNTSHTECICVLCRL